MRRRERWWIPAGRDPCDVGVEQMADHILPPELAKQAGDELAAGELSERELA